MILTWHPDDAATVERFKAVLGNKYFNHGGLLRVGGTELHDGEQLKVTVEPFQNGDSLTVHVPDANRGALISALATMPEEAFGWLVAACPRRLGGRPQIWPDSMGGFSPESRTSVEDVRQAAGEYMSQKK